MTEMALVHFETQYAIVAASVAKAVPADRAAIKAAFPIAFANLNVTAEAATESDVLPMVKALFEALPNLSALPGLTDAMPLSSVFKAALAEMSRGMSYAVQMGESFPTLFKASGVTRQLV